MPRPARISSSPRATSSSPSAPARARPRGPDPGGIGRAGREPRAAGRPLIVALASGDGGGTHIAPLLVELGAILLALGILGRLARWAHIPVVPLYLVAGLFFGQGGLVSLSASQDFLRVSADIGVVLLLVMLGLEYSAAELKSSLRTQAPIGVIDGVLNAAARRGRRAAGRMGCACSGDARRRDVGVVVGRDREDARRSRTAGQPRDPGDPRRARDGRPDDGAVPAVAHGVARGRRCGQRAARRRGRARDRHRRHRGRHPLRHRT